MFRSICRWLFLSVAVCAVPVACAHRSGEIASTTRPSASKPASKPVVAKWFSRPFPSDQVNVIVYGDFGNGKQTQKDTAKAMANYVAKTGTQFNAALTVGDNFYVKMRDADDWQFQSLFEDMYDAKKLNFPWFAIAGNHDYEWAEPRNGKNKVDLEREYSARHPDSRWKYPARWYRVDFPQDGTEPLLTVLMVDSSKPRLSKQEWEDQKQWIARELADSRATWRIACAHHPFFSNGSHGDNGVLQVEWGPIFKRGELDFYVAGHDHDLQHLQIEGWPYSFVVAGGGGQPLTDMRRDLRGPFSRKVYGFTHFQFLPDKAIVRIVASGEGKIVHQFERERASGAVRIVSTTGRDKATTKPLKTLAGLAETDVKDDGKKDGKGDGGKK